MCCDMETGTMILIEGLLLPKKSVIDFVILISQLGGGGTWGVKLTYLIFFVILKYFFSSS